MNVQPVNNVSFGQKVRFNKNIVNDCIEVVSTITPVASSASASLASGSGIMASQATGSALNITGTAFVSKTSGINSSGIVPSVMGSATPHLTPATVASSNNHPSIMGLLLSTIGDFFHSMGNANVTVKKPN